MSESTHVPDLPQAARPVSVFISYQRESELAAREVYEALTKAGFQVWQDVQNIRHTDRWPQAINQALRQTERLVLLLTPKAVDSQEVFNEWFDFYADSKPIHCLLVETCKPPHQLRPLQYLDWRVPASRDWARLIRELQADFVWQGQDTVAVVSKSLAPTRTLPEAFAALRQAVKQPGGRVALTDEQIEQIIHHKATTPEEQRLGRIAEWSKPRYQLDNRFVRLTLTIDRGEKATEGRWAEPQPGRTYQDVREILAERRDDTAFVVLGEPGCGKSTLLRRFQLDDAVDRLRDGGERLSFFISLNSYRPEREDEPYPSPRDWLAGEWQREYPALESFETLAQQGRLLLLLDALNEMPHRDFDEYMQRIDAWKHFLHTLRRDHAANRVVLTCRSRDYSAPLSTGELPVPQIEIQRLTVEQVQEFLDVYVPDLAAGIWQQLSGSAQFDLFRNPFYLKLLIEQAEANQGRIPTGRAALFTGFVRDMLKREIEAQNTLFRPDSLLDRDDYEQIIRADWADETDLPENGCLIARLSSLAYRMQAQTGQTGGGQVRVRDRQALELIAHECAREVVRAGLDMTVLDKQRHDVLFFHQLLQEYFAARTLAEQPDPALVRVEWQAERVKPSLAETLAELADSDPLPLLAQTGWEETAALAAGMMREPEAFARALLEHNLPLAARIAANPEARLGAALVRDIQDALIGRTQDARADLRARIAAGLALGEVGDPRFVRKTGPHGDYLLPPLAAIAAGAYPLGDDSSDYAQEKPAHTVELAAFQIGVFPVTNAEYRLFMQAGGYEDERWWQGEAAQAWRRGEGTAEGLKQGWRDARKTLQGLSESYILGLVQQNRITSKQAKDWITIRNWSDQEFATWLDETISGGRKVQPEYWEDAAFNNPAQPVVGVCWFEARAYCAWLTANAHTPDRTTGSGAQVFRLPSEAEVEAAARGRAGRAYAYGPAFDVTRGNTFESHIRRTTPVGIFGSATAEGVYDLSGNVWTWTSSIYDQERFAYPYRAGDGRENAGDADARRVLRGGSWYDNQYDARAASRVWSDPYDRNDYLGFRVVVGCPI